MWDVFGRNETMDANQLQGKRPGTLSVLRNRRFAHLFAAGATSIAGFSIGQAALNLVVFNTTESSLDLSFIGVAFILASVLFSLAAGAMVDRYERRKLMVISDLVRAASLGLLISYLVLFGFNLLVILAVAFVLGSFTTLFQPAERALTPEVVGQEQIGNANALEQTSNSLLQFSGLFVGGVIFAVAGAIVAFGLNVITFLVSATLIATIGVAATKKGAQPNEGKKRNSMVRDIREGFSYIAHNRGLLYLTLSAGAGNFFLSMVFQFFVVYAEEALHGNATTYGILSGLFALGWAPGAYASARFGTVRRAGLVWIVVGVLEGGCIVVLFFLPYLIPALVSMFVAGVLLGLANTTWLTAVQLIVPTEMQGRYFGLDQLGSFAVIPVGQVLGGLIITATSVNFDYLMAGIGTAASAGIFYLSPALRDLGWKSASVPMKPAEGAGGGTLAPLEGGIRTHESR
jgi:MFS transporter, DHA3 family, macrolide efflux protein